MDIDRAQYFESIGLQSWRLRGAEPADTAAPVPDSDAGTSDWENLEAAVRQCTLCELCKSRTQTVFGTGNRAARWMLIGEAPGAEEDRQGEPFVGRAGQLLNNMLLAAGFRRDDVFIANILKCRPPGNRDPKTEEAERCSPYLEQQIRLIGPDLIIAVGRIAAQRLLNVDAPLGRLRGRVHRYDPGNVPVVVTYHPAYLLRSPAQKRKSWEDLKLALAASGGKP